MTTKKCTSNTAENKTSYFKIGLACLVGNGIEIYDFVLFGLLAPMLGRLFFPTDDPSAQLLSTFTVFGIGFLMRPLGGLLLGHLGDRCGRRHALLLSILLMAGPTLVIGLLPTYQTIGLAAPLLLTAMRLLQGISMGGEYIGAMAYLLEQAPPHRKIFFSALPFNGAVLGWILASLMGSILTYSLSDEMLMAGGWRIPFLLGALPALIGFKLRRHLQESPAFLAIADSRHLEQLPIVTALQNYWRPMLALMGLVIPYTVGTYCLYIFLPSFLNVERHFSYHLVFALNMLPLFLILIFNPLAGILADRYGWSKQYVFCTLILVLGAVPLFNVIAYGTVWQIIGALCIFTFFQTFGGVAFAGALLQAFPTAVRYSASAVAYNSATSLFGGMTPLLSSLLSAKYGNTAPGYWLMAAAVVGCFSVVMMLRCLQRQPQSQRVVNLSLPPIS